MLAGFVVFAASATALRPQPRSSADGIVVLTGGEHRIVEAMALLADGHGRRLLVSGVHPQTTRDDLRRITGLDSLLFDCCVDIDHLALDTVGNANETRKWAGTWRFSSLIIVTSTYHMPRSLAELGRLMPTTRLVPYPVVSRNFVTREWWLHPPTARLLASEYLKYLPAVARLSLARIVGLPARDRPFESDRQIVRKN